MKACSLLSFIFIQNMDLIPRIFETTNLLKQLSCNLVQVVLQAIES